MFTELLSPFMGENLAGLVATIIWIALALIAIMIIWKMYLAFASSGVNLLGGKGRDVRLAIIDAAPVDQRRRIVLVRRDGVEHLLMIGGPNDIVIEQGITAPLSAANVAQPQSNQSAAAQPQVKASAPATPPKAPQTTAPAPQTNLAKAAPIAAPAAVATTPANPLDNFGDDITLDDDGLFDDLISEKLEGAKKDKIEINTLYADAAKPAPKPASTQPPEPKPTPIVEPKPDITAKPATNDLSLEDEMQALIRDLKAK